MTGDTTQPIYRPTCPADPRFVRVRGLDYHVYCWGQPGAEPPLVLLHGWMDVGASFQFVVDAAQATGLAGRWIIAPDWRGFGLTQAPQPIDSYWFPDYLGDLDGLLPALGIDGPIDLLGHSMGGNVVMTYAGVRPSRVRRLVNLEGFGLPRTEPHQAARRMAQWLDALAEPQEMKSYASRDEVAERLRKNNPRLAADKACWLAPHWSHLGEDGRHRILGDPAHKRPNPVLYRVEEHLETWKCITAPLLWVEAEGSQPEAWWGGRYSKTEFHQRLDAVRDVRREVLPDCGHMLHHDQPEALARLLAGFLAGHSGR
ncbi:MAG: alpha/beta hydrolase [Rubrivivax sp.]|nr:alpha/beta hydrolase [Rubrivivax sp.]